jgi:septum formation protein
MTQHPLLILASASPRRRELLAGMGHAFLVQPSGLEEKPWPGEKPASYALRNASDKARAVQATLAPGAPALIISADTIVVLGDIILEKPADAADAQRMLRELSGRPHQVITGLIVLGPDRERGLAVRTEVAFRALDEAEIAAYVATGEPMDKAGAYAIQGGAAGFVRETSGSYTNVVGLPVDELRRLLEGGGPPPDL